MPAALWLLAVAVVGYFVLRHRARSAAGPSPLAPSPVPEPAPSKSLPGPPSYAGLARALLAVTDKYLPTPETVLGEPDPGWDQILGGRIDKDRWGYFERGHGTSCGVTAAAWLAEAGGPPSMINRKPPEGAGFRIGAHITRLYQGAKSLGWLREPSSGQLPDLAPGDIFGSDRPAKDKSGKTISGEHVGVVRRVERREKELELETGDGGQQDAQGRQAARRRQRFVRISDGSLKYADGTSIPAGQLAIVSPGIGNSRLVWWIRTGGDTAATLAGAGDEPAGGLLLAAIRAGEHAPISWSGLDVPGLDLRLHVATDALKARVGGKLLRLPVSYLDTIEACRLLGDVVPPSQRLADAIYAGAERKTAYRSLVQSPADAGERMHSLGFVERFNADIEQQIGGLGQGLTAGAWKYWLLHARLGETVKGTRQPAAVNYGGWDRDGRPLQPVAAVHDVLHYDYSQLLQPLKRFATRISTGERIDLLDWIEREEGVPGKFTAVFR